MPSRHTHMNVTGQQDAGFLAAPGEADDWRRVVLTDAAVTTGLLETLPATSRVVAQRLGLDSHAVRVVLDALCEWDVVAVQDGIYRAGSAAPGPDTAAVLHHHARVIHRWSGSLQDRLRGAPAASDHSPSAGQRTPEERERWLAALGAQAQQRAGEVADHCLRRFPDTRSVLDLAGGHGEYGLEFARRGLDVTLQDLPEVIDLVRGWPKLCDGSVRLFSGDVFERLPDGPIDLVLCAGFTHTMPGDRVAELLLRLAVITAPSGGVAIHTFVRGHRPVAPVFAVQMLVAGQGGDTHGEDEYRAWLDAAGYRDVETADLGDRDLLLATRGGPSA